MATVKKQQRKNTTRNAKKRQHKNTQLRIQHAMQRNRT